MKIYVDADACPKPIKEILYKAAIRTNTPLELVANQPLSVAYHPLITAKQVPPGFDAADNYITENCQPQDLVITADIPLADQVISKRAAALNPRGMMYTKENIKQLLGMRDFMDQLRSSGIQTGGPKTFDQKDIQAFANELDRYLTKYRSN